MKGFVWGPAGQGEGAGEASAALAWGPLSPKILSPKSFQHSFSFNSQGQAPEMPRWGWERGDGSSHRALPEHQLCARLRGPEEESDTAGRIRRTPCNPNPGSDGASREPAGEGSFPGRAASQQGGPLSPLTVCSGGKGSAWLGAQRPPTGAPLTSQALEGQLNGVGLGRTPPRGQVPEVVLCSHSPTESPNLPEEGTIIIPVFQEGKLRHREGQVTCPKPSSEGLTDQGSELISTWLCDPDHHTHTALGTRQRAGQGWARTPGLIPLGSNPSSSSPAVQPWKGQLTSTCFSFPI